MGRNSASPHTKTGRTSSCQPARYFPRILDDCHFTVHASRPAALIAKSLFRPPHSRICTTVETHSPSPHVHRKEVRGDVMTCRCFTIQYGGVDLTLLILLMQQICVGEKQSCVWSIFQGVQIGIHNCRLDRRARCSVLHVGKKKRRLLQSGRERITAHES